VASIVSALLGACCLPSLTAGEICSVLDAEPTLATDDLLATAVVPGLVQTTIAGGCVLLLDEAGLVRTTGAPGATATGAGLLVLAAGVLEPEVLPVKLGALLLLLPDGTGESSTTVLNRGVIITLPEGDSPGEGAANPLLLPLLLLLLLALGLGDAPGARSLCTAPCLECLARTGAG
jgi:hypothetical protein